MNKSLVWISMPTLLMLLGCQPTENTQKNSGLKNMAPVSANHELKDDIEVEPNDSPLQAAEINFTGDEFRFTATLGPEDQDFWRIKAKTGTVVDIAISPEAGLDLRASYAFNDKNAQTKHYDAEAAGKPEILSQLRLNPQGAIISIQGKNTQEQRYQVTITRLHAMQGQQLEEEPNDTLAQAQLINSIGTVLGSSNPSGDVDYYKVQIANASFIEWLTDKGEFELAILSNNAVLWSQTIVNQTYRTREINGGEGLYFRVKSLSALDKGFKYQFQLQDFVKGTDLEPNNSIAEAQEITLFNEALSLNFQSSDDVDFFKLSNQNTETLRYHILPAEAGPSPYQMKLLQANGTALTGQPYQDEPSTFCNLLLAPQESLYLQVNAKSKFESYPKPYKIVVNSEIQKNQNLKTYEKEGNDSLETASEGNFNLPIYGNIFPANDKDVYAFRVPAYEDGSQEARLTITLSPGYILPLTLQLNDSEAFSISKINTQQLTKPTVLVADVKADADYHLVISSDSKQSDNCRKPYELSIKLSKLSSAPVPHADQDIEKVLETAGQFKPQPLPEPQPSQLPSPPTYDDRDSF